MAGAYAGRGGFQPVPATVHPAQAMIFATQRLVAVRRGQPAHVGAIVECINPRFAGPTAMVYVMNPPLPFDPHPKRLPPGGPAGAGLLRSPSAAPARPVAGGVAGRRPAPNNADVRSAQARRRRDPPDTDRRKATGVSIRTIEYRLWR